MNYVLLCRFWLLRCIHWHWMLISAKVSTRWVSSRWCRIEDVCVCVCACSWCYEVSREMGQPSWPHVAACKPLGTCGGCFGGLKSPADRTRAQFSAGAQHRRTLALAVGRSLSALSFWKHLNQFVSWFVLRFIKLRSSTQSFVAITFLLMGRLRKQKHLASTV